jgi:hypothetical protein
MNNLISNNRIRGWIGTLAFTLILLIMGAAVSTASATNDNDFEIKSMDNDQLTKEVPGDHDDIHGNKNPFEKVPNGTSGNRAHILPSADAFGKRVQTPLCMATWLKHFIRFHYFN